MTIHKKILEWQTAHPNTTWLGRGVVWLIFLQFCSGRGKAVALRTGGSHIFARADGVIKMVRRSYRCRYPLPTRVKIFRVKPTTIALNATVATGSNTRGECNMPKWTLAVRRSQLALGRRPEYR